MVLSSENFANLNDEFLDAGCESEGRWWTAIGFLVAQGLYTRKKALRHVRSVKRTNGENQAYKAMQRARRQHSSGELRNTGGEQQFFARLTQRGLNMQWVFSGEFHLRRRSLLGDEKQQQLHF
nr:hypothetical protein Itr_chr04CG11360 [Ipomoea trifida]